MATYQVGASEDADYASLDIAYDNINSGDTLELENQVHDSDTATVLNYTKDVILKPVSGAACDGITWTDGARIVWDADDHIWGSDDGTTYHSGDITAEDIIIQSNTASGDDSNEVIRGGAALTGTWKRCMIGTDGTSGDESAFSQIDDGGIVHVFENCLIRHFRRSSSSYGAIWQFNWTSGASFTFKQCTVDIVGAFTDLRSNSGTMDFDGCALNSDDANPFDGMGSATFDMTDCVMEFVKPSDLDTDTGNEDEQAFTDSTSTTGMIVTSLTDGDYTPQEPTGGATNHLLDHVDPIVVSGVDIAGVTRPASAPHDAGCFELVDAGTDVTAELGKIEVKGFDATVTAETDVTAQLGKVEVKGLNPSWVGVPLAVAAELGKVEVKGLDASVTAETDVVAQLGKIEVKGFDATVPLETATNVTAQLGKIEVQGQDATVTAETDVAAQLGKVEVKGFNATVTANTDVTAKLGKIEVGGQNANVMYPTPVSSQLGKVEVKGFDTTVVLGGTINISPGAVAPSNSIHWPHVFWTLEFEVFGQNLLEGLTVLYPPPGDAFGLTPVVVAESFHIVGLASYRLGVRVQDSKPGIYQCFVEMCYGHKGTNLGTITRYHAPLHIRSRNGIVTVDLDKPSNPGTDTTLSGQAMPTCYFEWDYINDTLVQKVEAYTWAWQNTKFYLRRPHDTGQSSGGRMSFRYQIAPDEITRRNCYPLATSGGFWGENDGRRVLANDDWYSYNHPHIFFPFGQNDPHRKPNGVWDNWISVWNSQASHDWDDTIYSPDSHCTSGFGAVCAGVIQGGEEYQTDMGFQWLVMARAAHFLTQQPDPNGYWSTRSASNFSYTGRSAGRLVQLASELIWALNKILVYRDTNEVRGLINLLQARLAQILNYQYTTWQANGAPQNPGQWLLGGFRANYYVGSFPGSIGSTGLSPDRYNSIDSFAWWMQGHAFNGFYRYQETRWALGLGTDDAVWQMMRKTAEELWDAIIDWSGGHPFANQWPGSTKYPTDPRTGAYYNSQGISRYGVYYWQVVPQFNPTLQWLSHPSAASAKYNVAAVEFLMYNGYKEAEKTKGTHILEDWDHVGYWWRLGQTLRPQEVFPVNAIPGVANVTGDASQFPTPNAVEESNSVPAPTITTDYTIDLSDTDEQPESKVEPTNTVPLVQNVQLVGGAQGISPLAVLSENSVKPVTSVVISTIAVSPNAVEPTNVVGSPTVTTDVTVSPSAVSPDNSVPALSISPIEIGPGAVAPTNSVPLVRGVGGIYHAFVRYVGDGSATTFAIPFPYLTEEHIRVYVAGVELVFDDDYTVSGNTATLATAPANLATVTVLRRTMHSDLWIRFPDGSQPTQGDWQQALRQVLYYTEEVQDMRTGYTV